VIEDPVDANGCSRPSGNGACGCIWTIVRKRLFVPFLPLPVAVERPEDRSILPGQHLPGNKEHAAVLERVMDIARSFNLDVIAEGVETAEQVELLRGLHCDQVQGYLFGRPQDAENAEEFIRRQRCSQPAAGDVTVALVAGCRRG